MILIAGGAGYIGSHMNKMLSKMGYDTLGVDNLVHGHEEMVKWGELIKGDLADTALLKRIFGEHEIKAVMHFAAYAYVGESVTDPAKYYMNNVTNTVNLLNVMLEHGVDKFIFSSSCATYGVPDTIPIPETHPQTPVNPYGRTKLMVENILSDYSSAYDMKYVSLRYFNAAGADPEAEIGEWHEPETHLIPLVLDTAIGRRTDIRVFGTDYDTPDGTCVRDYIHVNDLAKAHVLALKYLDEHGRSELFNLGNGRGFSVRQVIETARRVTSRDIRSVDSDRRPGDPPALVGSASRAVETLGWEPEFPDIESIIRTAWKWHRKKWSA
jgi:UDP-glucose 4-epimerase